MSFIEYALLGCMTLVFLVAAMFWMTEHMCGHPEFQELNPTEQLPTIKPKSLKACGGGVYCNKSTNCPDIYCPGRNS